ncbi:hypothetical protein PTKIN_Ptkin14bG0154000 [Pterospermum kingtungense]
MPWPSGLAVELRVHFSDFVAQNFGKPVMLSGPCLPEAKANQLDEKWASWLSVVFCSFGSQSILQKEEFQELLLGFEKWASWLSGSFKTTRRMFDGGKSIS